MNGVLFMAGDVSVTGVTASSITCTGPLTAGVWSREGLRGIVIVTSGLITWGEDQVIGMDPNDTAATCPLWLWAAYYVKS